MDYKKYPLSISIVYPFVKKNSKIFYFLGNVPIDVLNAAKTGYMNKNNEMEWKPSEKRILKDFYGVNWHSILTGTEPSAELKANFNIYKYVRRAANALITGGEESLLFGDMSAFDSDVHVTSKKESEMSKLLFTSSEKIVYTNLSVYPEDTIYDVRIKAQLITRIPIYRQFLFYYIDDYGPYYTYQITINKIPYTIRWDEILKKYDLSIDGIGIDAYFEQNKQEIEISSYDKSILLESKSGHRINKIYIIDLFDIIKEKNIIDKYQFNLIYYGFIIKYWPQLTPEMFKLAMSNPDAIYTAHPMLSYNFDDLYKSQTVEQSVFNMVHSYVNNNTEVTITNISIIVNPKALKLNVNIRNVFDKLVLNSKVNGMFMNILYGIRKQYFIHKRHASILNQNFIINTHKNTIAICIEENEQQIILTISRSGAYEVSTQWREEDNINFTNIIKILSIHVNPVIESINNLGIYAFPNGGQLYPLSKDIIFNLLTLSVYFNFSFSTYEFNSLKNYFKKYEYLNIIKVYGLQISRIFTFVFYRGIVNNNIVYDSYDWLYGENMQNGRRIRIIHRSDKLQIEMNNLQSMDEYKTIKKYLFALIDEFIKVNKLKSNKKIETNLKTIRKLHDLDPELFNITKYDSNATTYSVLCQSQRQPKIYEEEDLKFFTKEKLSKIVKYWNFTYNRPAYYLCEGKYQYINFIVNKHPKNYCMPCCKKLKDIPETEVAKINKLCLENKTYKLEAVDSQYVLSFGKKLVIGRKSYIPNSLKYLLPNHFIVGVKQSESNNTNIGFIESVKYVLGDIINDLAIFAKEMEQFYTLANGKAKIFKSSDELSSELLANFKLKNNMLLTNVDMTLWKHIISDLIRYKYNIEILEIVYKEDKLFLQAYESLEETKVEKIILLFSDVENGTNPIIGNEKVFSSSLCKFLFAEKTKKLTLNFIIEYTKNKGKRIDKFLINMKNLCYAVIINGIYLPIIPSYCSSNTDLHFDIRPEATFSRNEICDLIKDLKITINVTQILTNKKDIGFISSDGLVFYHRPEDPDLSNSLLSVAYKNAKLFIPYDLRNIDSAILKRNVVTNLSHSGLLKKVENNYYNLFLSEFIHEIQKEKNMAMRDELKRLLMNIDFLDSKSIEALNNKLSQLLSKFPIDLLIIYDYIENAYFNASDTKTLASFIDVSVFEFDYQLFYDLKNITDKNVLIKKLKEIMNNKYILGEIKDIPQYYNIFTSCSNESNQFFCKDNKIIVPKDKIDDFFDILSDDIMNRSKTYILMSASSGIFNYFDFIRRPHEFIEITENKL